MLDLGELAIKLKVDDDGATNQLQNFGTQTQTLEQKSVSLKDSLKGMVKGLAIGAVIKKTADAVVGMVQKADELNQSFNTLQTQTGATDEEMGELEQTLKNIYANNYGEDFEDIALAMSEVKKQTDLTGEALQTTTENALALRDTFGYEVQESTRAADMMMKQFGITSDEAFNLIAQGSQNGLDKNGNLLDSINEYSVHFNQLGLDSEDMFNMFANGAESGVFDIDKLGDAVKEFGIRAKDGSNTTIEAYESLGLNADELQAKFSAGGETANEAFKEVTNAINNCDDEVIKNTAGVNLFGTMWEDMGSAAVTALADTNGEFSTTANNLNKIKEIKYDDLGSAFEGIGRQLEMGLTIPIGEKLLPLINEFANWINEHMPEIQAVVETVMATIGALIEGLSAMISALVTSAQTEGTYFNAVWKEIQIVFETVFKAIQDIFAIFTALFKGDWEALWEGVKTLISDVWDGIKSLVENRLKAIINALDGMKQAFKNAATALFNKIKDGFSEVWNKIKAWVTDSFNSMVADIKGFGSKMFSSGQEIITQVWDGMKNIWSNVTSWIADKAQEIADTLMFWKDSQDEMSEDSSDGSHRTGLSIVPFDGYKSILHKGEMVLTQPEADRYRTGETQTKGSGDFIINIDRVENSNSRSVTDFLKEAEFYRKSKQLAVGGA